jgi:HD-GYP domain-containing protein (c-di-GMP phosphodiesterase class II)
VLNKPGALDADEIAKVREHPVIGRRIIEPLIDVQEVQAMTLWHHERWDGNGYPDRLSRGRIPSAALVLAVADTLDAMTSSRAYRPAHSWDFAVSEIRTQAGAQFSPEIVAAFDSCLPQLRTRYEQLQYPAGALALRTQP